VIPTFFVYCKCADDATLLTTEECDVRIENELENIIRWSNVNKLQLTLGKSEEIPAFECTYGYFLSVQLNSIQQLECVMLFVFTDFKLTFHEHVERLLSVCN